MKFERLAFDSNAYHTISFSRTVVRAMIVLGTQGEPMEGMHFVTKEKGKKVAVQLDLERDGELWEDIHDQLVASSRAQEKSIPFAYTRESVKAP